MADNSKDKRRRSQQQESMADNSKDKRKLSQQQESKAENSKDKRRRSQQQESMADNSKDKRRRSQQQESMADNSKDKPKESTKSQDGAKHKESTKSQDNAKRKESSAKKDSVMFSMDKEGAPASVYRSLSVQEEGLPRRALSASARVIINEGSSYYYVRKSYESLNYRPVMNQIELETEKTYTYHTVKSQAVFRVGIFLLAGALTGAVGTMIEYSIDHLGHYKYSEFEKVAKDQYDGTFKQFLSFVEYRVIGVIVPAVMSAALVVFIAPHAAGGGVAQCIAYLNGVRVPKVLSIKGLIIKILSTICTVVSGLAGGKEGPMMHIGAIIAGSMPSALPCTTFRLDHERRDFAAAGFGAGLGVVFGAPIGGLLISLEEGCSFLNIELMWKIYLCCVMGYAVCAVTTSIVEDGEVSLYTSKMLSLGKISSDVTTYYFFELVPFSVMAVIGGLLGALCIKIHIITAVYRDRYINTSKFRRMLAAFIAAVVLAAAQVLSIWYVRSCSKPTKETPQDRHHRMYCPEGKRSDMSLMLSLTQGDLLRLYFGQDPLEIPSLLTFSVIYFVSICVTMILSVSAGVFIPHIILGAAWGRLFGVWMSHLSHGADWAKPAKYAYLGAAAQLSGMVGKTFSILVIFVEASGSTSLSFPLMVIVSITKTVCCFFVEPIYESQMRIMGLPFLPHHPPPVDCDIATTRDMSRDLVTLPPTTTVRVVIDTLRGNTHQGYPIVQTQADTKRTVLLGLILRQHLLILLKYKAYLYPAPATNAQMCECYAIYLRDSRTRLPEQQILDGIEEEDLGREMDLRPYYNLYPPTVTNDMPMTKTYEYFRYMGLRHLVVVTKNFEPVGMITRKDLAKYHTDEHCCKVHVRELNIT